MSQILTALQGTMVMEIQPISSCSDAARSEGLCRRTISSKVIIITRQSQPVANKAWDGIVGPGYILGCFQRLALCLWRSSQIGYSCSNTILKDFGFSPAPAGYSNHTGTLFVGFLLFSVNFWKLISKLARKIVPNDSIEIHFSLFVKAFLICQNWFTNYRRKCFTENKRCSWRTDMSLQKTHKSRWSLALFKQSQNDFRHSGCNAPTH